MSASTKKKYVEQEATYDLILPEPPNFIGRILAGRGNNLHEIESENGEQFLVSMPTKFRKNVWVKRGDFVLCEPILEGDKVKAEITRVLLKDNIKYIKNNHRWPKRFDDLISSVIASLDSQNSNTYEIDKDLLPPSEGSDSEIDEDDDLDEEDAETSDKDEDSSDQEKEEKHTKKKGNLN